MSATAVPDTRRTSSGTPAGARARRPARLARGLHPAAWWVWALGLAVAAASTTNPVVLLLVLAVSAFVVVARRGSDPWARAYGLYLLLGAGVVVLRLVLHVAVGLKLGQHVLLRLPQATLPSWAAGIELGGTVYLEGLVQAAVDGLRLATIIACVGAANALANPKRLLRTLPGALHELGVAVVISVSVAPQLAESVQRVRRARRLRGDASRGPRSVAAVALPVLQDTLDRSLLLAAAMDSRGYGRRPDGSLAARRATSALMLAGLVGAAIGTYGLLDATAPALLGLPMLAVGLALAVLGLRAGGRRVVHSTYRPDPWSWPEWATAAAGVVAAAALLVTARTDPASAQLSTEPLRAPDLAWPVLVGLLLAATPAATAPPPVREAG